MGLYYILSMQSGETNYLFLYDLVLIVCVFKFMLKSFFQSVDLISIFTLCQELIVGYLMGFTISCLEQNKQNIRKDHV
jgi:hypothetical protein